MKRTPNYYVAVYSAQECVICSPNDAMTRLPCVPHDAPPDDQQLLTLQNTVKAFTKHRLVVLVPDSWLSVTEHQIDHPIPPPLQPLAALSYAAEATFTAPDSVRLSYQYALLSSKQAILTVFACSVAWFEQLCKPFQANAAPYLIVPASQWFDNAVPARRKTWRYCQKNALLIYQPDQDRRRQSRRLWWGLLISSLILNAAAGWFLLALQHTTQGLEIDQQTALQRQPEWSNSPSQHGFVDSVLGLTQALPRSVRVLSVSKEKGRAELRMLLPASHLDSMLAGWRRQQPTWQWQLIEHEGRSLSPAQSVEVVNVSITILAGE